MKINITIKTFLLIGIIACTNQTEKMVNPVKKKVEQFAEFELKADLISLSQNQRQMISIFLEISDIMDDLFWKQAYGNKSKLLDTISDSYLKKFVEINYGPWERLNENKSFVEGIGEKPKGANFYPTDMTEDEFKALEDNSKTSLYTVINRNEEGNLISVPYSVAYKEELQKAADLLKKAAKLAEDPGFKKYLELRAEAFLTDNYQPSDMAWMEMKSNTLDFVVGPIENYEDKLFGYKAAFEAYVLVKDKEWSEKLDHYATLLPVLQKNLPVEDKYKQESPGSDSDLGAYEVLYYAGDCNAGSKTIAINLPNDEEVQLAKGSRRLQLKNAMQAKFDKILVPIANELIVEDQRQSLTFKAFFEDVMFHEVAHGLGIKNVIGQDISVREALKNHYSSLEEGKADILGLYLITELVNMNELETDLIDTYTTFLAGIFRSIRFGTSSAHGVANLMRYNYFKEMGAFTRSEEGLYSVNFEKMKAAMTSLSEKILVIQGDGDYAKADTFIKKYGVMPEELRADLDKINQKGIPVDIVFKQGAEVLEL